MPSALLSFSRLPFAVMLCCLVLTCGCIFGLRALHTYEASVLTGNSCALPCFYGVTPGEISRSQAVAIFTAQNPIIRVTEDPLVFTLLDVHNRRVMVSIFSDDSGLVDSLRLNAPPILADLLLEGHQPNRVFRTCTDMYPVRFMITFGTQDELLIELFPRDKLNPNTRPAVFDIAGAGSRSLYDERISFGCSVETPWYGFAPIWKYFRAGAS